MKTQTFKTAIFLLLTIISNSLFAQDLSCDDLTNTDEWPEEEFWEAAEMIGDTIGYTQEGTQPVTVSHSTGGWFTINNYEDVGIYGDVELNFEFDGSYQQVRFLVYGWIEEGTTIGFSVNESSTILYDEAFPMIVDGVTVDIDLSPEDADDSWEYFYLTLSGEIDSVNHILFESGIQELCITPLFEEESCDDFMDPLEYPEVIYSGTDFEGDTIGYTQGGTQPITIGEHSEAWTYLAINPGFGISGAGATINFAFDGTYKSARFHLSESDLGLSTGRSFSVNGSTYTSMYGTYPMVLGGVTVDLDTSSAPDLTGFYDVYLIFTGNIDLISIRNEDTHESSIVELCIGNFFTEDECDDFTNAPWPEDEIFEPGEIIGYTQSETYPVTVGDEGSVLVNTDMTYFPGLFINNAPLIFDFDGSNQVVQFEIYEWFGAGTEGFELNGEPITLFDTLYPLTIDGVDVNLVISGETIGTAEVAYLTFDGHIDEIVMVGGELGITKLCFEEDTILPGDLSIDAFDTKSISIYPNPASQFVSIEANRKIKEIQIYAVSGELVLSETDINQNQTTLPLTNFKQGFYLVQLLFEDGTKTTEKLIRE